MSAQKGIGRVISFGICKEATRGTSPSTASYWVPYADASPESKIENVKDVQAYGIIEDHVNETRVKNWMQGDFSAYVRDTHFGLILKSLFGSEAVATHAGESIVYDHTFTVGESAQHPSLSFYKHDPLAAQDYTYANGVIDKLDLDYSLKKYIQYKASIMAQAGVQVSTLTPSTTAENYFVPQYLSAGFASSLSGLSSPTVVALKSMKLSIDQSVESQDVLGSLSPADFLNKDFKISGTFEAIWKGEADFFANYIANTYQAMQLKAVNSDVTIGSTSHPTLTIQLAKCWFEEVTKPIKIDDLVYQTVKFSAAYSTGDTQMGNAVLTNLVSSAY
jgi:hypothetical protein